MRLLQLQEHESYIKYYLDMYVDHLIEQEAELGQKKSRNEIKDHCERMLKERLFDSNRHIFLFEKVKSSIIGFAEISLQEECFPDEDLPEKCMKVITFYIVPSCRKQKLGSSFFGLLRNWGRDQQAALVEMEVNPFIMGVGQFLSHQGLELVGTGEKNCYRSFI